MRYKGYQIPYVVCCYRKCKRLFPRHASELAKKKTSLNFCCMNCRYLYVRDPKVIKERFWSYVEVKSELECWIWIGARDKDGYGIFDYLTIKKKVKGKSHRISWKIYFGKVPKGLCICHTCDNPPCCNPDHMFLGTPQDNTNDMVKKMRHKYGEKHLWAKITERDVRNMYRWKLKGFSDQEIANRLNISVSHVGNTLRGNRWRHLHV